MKERPILFSGPMVRKLLAGEKTQTRRLMNPQPWFDSNWGTRVGMSGSWRYGSPRAQGLSDKGDLWSVEFNADNQRRACTAEAYGWGAGAGCPYGQPGDRLWVRETWAAHWMYDDLSPSEIPAKGEGNNYWYAADPEGSRGSDGSPAEGRRGRWRPSIHMVRSTSRITLEVTEVRVQRLQDIGEEDAKAEGVQPAPFCKAGRPAGMEHVEAFEDLWNEINGPGAWDLNPWVWAVSFEVRP